MTQERVTFCRICEAACGLRVEVDDGRVTAIRPDPDHVVSRGYACAKGTGYIDVHNSPDRLRRPLRRDGDRFTEVDWDTALDDIAQRLRRIIDRHGPHAVGMYFGNPTAFGTLHPIFAHAFMRGIGSRNVFSAGSQDCNNKFLVAELMYGSPALQPIPDLDRTECLVVLGSNPVVSHMSFVSVPRPVERLRAIERRGGAVFFFDPRRTESARTVGRHVFVKPDTDVFVLLSFLDELVARGRVDVRRLEQTSRGWPRLEALARQWPASRTAAVTGVTEEQLAEVVDRFSTADGAALYCSTGINQGSWGTLAFWLLNAINAVTGNLDRPGGVLVPRGPVDVPKWTKRIGFGHGRARSRVGGFRQIAETLPAGILADEITEPGPEQLRALVVTAGNPLLSCPDEARLASAFGALDLLVTLDLFRNETAELAHYVLPAASFLERPDLPIALHGMQPVPYLQYTDAAVPPDGEQREEWWVYTELARRAQIPMFGSRPLSKLLTSAVGAQRIPILQRLAPRSEQLLGTLLATMGRTLRSVRRHPSGQLLRSTEGGDFLGRRVLTDDRLVDLAPAELADAAERELPAAFDEELSDTSLRLISKREKLSHNSWMHNAERFVRHGTNYVYVHPADAAARGLSDGDRARVRANGREITLPVQLSDDLMPGAVAVPHGWGHATARGLRVAREAAGENVNRLAASGPGALERFAGMTHLTGIRIELERA